MRAFLGVDLGSTTTKAVLLDEKGGILGRGLTNTRANFETACAVARAEALADARFGLLAEPARSGARRAYHRAERGRRLEHLRARTLLLADDDARLQVAASRLFEALAKLASAEDGAVSFRDAVAEAAATAAEAVATAAGVPYERLMSALERALVADEADPTALDPDAVLDEIGVPAGERVPVDVAAQSGTGYGRHRLPFAPGEIRSEILCHGLGASHAFPGTRTVLDIGGQDTKAIQLDERGLVTSFQMNDRCAAGCGRYLGYVAEELGVGLPDLAPLALSAHCPSRINSTCTVFAGAEIRERLALGERREDVVAGLHRAIVLRALGLLARAGGVHSPLTFSGGVARNEAVVRSLRDELSRHYRDVAVNVSTDSIFNGAVGAALFALRETAAC
ncbi:MAG: BadF/BadG/BcrA/BcrD ATPase family protein [Myxococcota bacterium]